VAAQRDGQEPALASSREGAAGARMRSAVGAKSAPKSEAPTRAVEGGAVRRGAVQRVARTPCRSKLRRARRPPAPSYGPSYSTPIPPAAPQLQRTGLHSRPSLSHCRHLPPWRTSVPMHQMTRGGTVAAISTWALAK